MVHDTAIYLDSEGKVLRMIIENDTYPRDITVCTNDAITLFAWYNHETHGAVQIECSLADISTTELLALRL